MIVENGVAVSFGLYIFFGVIISVVITYTLLLCDIILNGRVYLTTESLNTGAIGSAWCAWVGTSLALCLGAAFCVLVEPAAASSGIPGLLAYLNGVTPKAGKSFITGKDTDFLSYQTMFSKLVGMIFPFHLVYALARKVLLSTFRHCWHVG